MPDARLIEPSIYAKNDIVMDCCTRCGYYTNIENLIEYKGNARYVQTLCQDCYAEDQAYQAERIEEEKKYGDI